MGEMFKNLPNLIEFKMSYTKIRSIPEDCFKRSTKMVKLDLSNNQITDFYDKSWRNLVNLKELDLSHNEISRSFSYMFANLKQLEVLDLSNNKFYEFTDKVFGGLQNLKVLKLNNNNLINLKDNAILFKLNYLQFLNLSNCNLRRLDSEFLEKLPNLTTLDLAHNNLFNLNGEHFKNLTNLKMVNLSFNNFEMIDNNVFESMKLNHLDLSNNKRLNNLERFAFKDLNCTNLKLSNNFDLNINAARTALDNMAYVEHLDLSSTNIKDIDLEFEPFQQQAYYLKKLNLSNNLLFNLPRMSDFRMIRELDLSNNQIKSLNQVQAIMPDILNKLDNQQTILYLHQNPFSCFKCDLIYLQIFTQLNRKCLEEDYYCIRCAEPETLNMRKARDLDVADLYSCNIPKPLLSFLKTAKTNFGFIIVIVIVAVIISIFIFLLILYRQKICRAIFQNGHYYTREPKNELLTNSDPKELNESKKASSSNKETQKSLKSTIKKNIINSSAINLIANHFNQNEQNIYKIDLPVQDNKMSNINLKENSALHKRVSILSKHLEDNDLLKNNNSLQKLSPESLVPNRTEFYKSKNEQQVESSNLNQDSITIEKIVDLSTEEDECSKGFLV